MKARAVWIGCSALALSHAAPADEAGVYIGVDIGYVDAPKNVGLIVPDVPLLTGETDGSEFAAGATLGYRFNRNIAVELGYVDVRFDANVVDASGISDASSRLGFSIDGIALALLGFFPVGHWAPYVKAGVLFSDTALTYSGNIAGDEFSARIGNSAEDALYGLGVRYRLSEHLELSLDSTYFMEVGEPGSGQSDFWKTSAGVIWRF